MPAAAAPSGRSAETVFGGHEQVLRQTLVFLYRGRCGRRGSRRCAGHRLFGPRLIVVASATGDCRGERCRRSDGSDPAGYCPVHSRIVARSGLCTDRLSSRTRCCVDRHGRQRRGDSSPTSVGRRVQETGPPQSGSRDLSGIVLPLPTTPELLRSAGSTGGALGAQHLQSQPIPSRRQLAQECAQAFCRNAHGHPACARKGRVVS